MSAAWAQDTVYKCQRPGGIVEYSDKPCPRGALIKAIPVPKPPPPQRYDPVHEPPPNPRPEPNLADPGSSSAATPPPPEAVLDDEASFRCQAYDGSVYFSASNMPRRRQVPVAELPEALRPPSDQIELGMAWVEDQCTPSSAREACAHSDEQIRYQEALQRRSQGEDLRKSIRELQRLRTIRNRRCG
jgi:hypothetical protein